MRFQLLGPLEVRSETGAAVKVGGPNSRRLLAALLLAANDVMPADRLVDVVWETRPPVSARRNLQTYVWNLRRVLAWPGSPPRLVTGPGGYLLRTEQDELDRDRFQALAARGRELLAEDPVQARSFLRAALAQWHGAALADLAAGSTGLHTAAAQLDEQRLEVWEDCIEAEHAAGRPAETVAELVGLTLAHPWRENLYRLYMLALYRCGRQADALDAFRRLASQLRDELGIDPSPRLTALHHSILRGDPALDLAAGARPTLLAARPARPGRASVCAAAAPGAPAAVHRPDRSARVAERLPGGRREHRRHGGDLGHRRDSGDRQDSAGGPVRPPGGGPVPGWAAVCEPAGIRPFRIADDARRSAARVPRRPRGRPGADSGQPAGTGGPVPQPACRPARARAARQRPRRRSGASAAAR